MYAALVFESRGTEGFPTVGAANEISQRRWRMLKRKNHFFEGFNITGSQPFWLAGQWFSVGLDFKKAAILMCQTQKFKKFTKY